jgi:hypothetical protein
MLRFELRAPALPPALIESAIAGLFTAESDEYPDDVIDLASEIREAEERLS